MPTNPTEPSTTNGSILDGLDTSVQTYGDAVVHYANILKRRRGVRYCNVQGSGGSNYTWVMPDATVTLAMSYGHYPVTVGYTAGPSTGSAIFESFNQAIDWIVESLKPSA